MKKILISLSMLALVSGINAQDLEDLLGQLAGSGAKATYETSYEFNTYIQMSMSDQDDKTTVYEGYLSKDGKATAILFTDFGAKSVVLIDTRNNALLLLTEDEGEKTGLAMGFDPGALAEMSEGLRNEADHDIEPSKTGKSKEILGYTCYEYLIEEEDGRVQMWVSPELGQEIDQHLLVNEQVFGSAFLHVANASGLVMEYNFSDNNSGERRSLKITGLDLKAGFSLSTEDYAIMSMGQ